MQNEKERMKINNAFKRERKGKKEKEREYIATGINTQVVTQSNCAIYKRKKIIFTSKKFI